MVSNSRADAPQPAPDQQSESSTLGDLGLVMGGGGARAAYQVGVLRYLADRFPDLRIPYITGVSAGAINVAHIAAHHGTFRQAIAELDSLWGNLHVKDVFKVDSWSLAKNVAGWGLKLVSGGARVSGRARGLVDTEPLRRFLTEALHAVDGEITGIQYNLERGRLQAAALSTSSYSTGQSITWVQGKNISDWARPYRRSFQAVLTVEHVMASAALPLFFPAVALNGRWHGDGGVRLTAPLSPVIHLGARRVIAISTRYDRTQVEADVSAVKGYPPPAQIIGVLMNSVFLDLLDADALRLDRINQLLEYLPPERRRGLRDLHLLTLRPSVDLGRLARDHEVRLPKAFRFMTRGLGTRATESPDVLSLILFEPPYVRALIEIGEEDAYNQRERIDTFIEAALADR